MLGRPEVDLAAAVWSLDYNLGSGFGGEFLRAYGWPQDDDGMVERLRVSYEVSDWGESADRAALGGLGILCDTSG